MTSHRYGCKGEGGDPLDGERLRSPFWLDARRVAAVTLELN